MCAIGIMFRKYSLLWKVKVKTILSYCDFMESVATIEPVICFSSLAKTVRHDLLKYTTVVLVLFL